jgi:hypothetical protein
MTTDQPTPAPPWARAIDRNRRPVAQVLLALALVLLLATIFVGFRYGTPQAPAVVGTFLVALAALGGGLWFLSDPSGDVRGTDAARILVLIEGGVLGLALSVFTVWQMVLWWKVVSGGTAAWRGEDRWELWVLSATGVAGLAAMFFSLLLARGEENANRTLRLLLYGYNAVLTGLLLLGFLLVLNVLAYFTLPETSDWTLSGIYTLDARSENVLKGLTQPVHIYVIEEDRNTLLSQETHELMDNIRSASDRVGVEFLLRDLNIDSVGDLMQKYKLADDTGILVVYGSGDKQLHQFIRQGELTQTPMPDPMRDPEAPPPQRTFRGEDLVVSAIDFMEMDQKKPTVYFVQGNGCLDLFGLDPKAKPDRRGRALADRLQEDHYEIKGLVLGNTPLPGADPRVTVSEAVPDDASVVAIVRPQEAFTEKQLGALRDYMKTRYRLTEATLAVLRTAGLPATAVERLKAMTDKDLSPEDLRQELTKSLDKSDLEKQTSLVLKHARREGKLMVLLDVVPDKENPKRMANLGIEGLLGEFDVDAPGERVLRFDPDAPEVLLVETNPDLRGKNPLATAFEGRPLQMANVRLVQARPGPGGPGRHQVDILLETVHPMRLRVPRGVFAEASLGDASELIKTRAAELKSKVVAVLPVGVAVSDPGEPDPHAFMRGGRGGDGPPRMVVLGAASFASDAAIAGGRGRAAEQGGGGDSLGYDLFSSALSWLREKPSSIGVTRKERGIYKIEAGSNVGSMLLSPVVLMGVAIIGLGVGVWVVRRR